MTKGVSCTWLQPITLRTRCSEGSATPSSPSPKPSGGHIRTASRVPITPVIRWRGSCWSSSSSLAFCGWFRVNHEVQQHPQRLYDRSADLAAGRDRLHHPPQPLTRKEQIGKRTELPRKGRLPCLHQNSRWKRSAAADYGAAARCHLGRRL